MTASGRPDCGSDTTPLPVEQARARILATVEPLMATVSVPLREGLHRVLAEPVTAAVDVPGHDNSAMDGFAVRAVDVQPGAELRLAGDSFAGHPFDGMVAAVECVRIMTGAVLPDGADTVVMQEHTQVRDGRVRFTQAPEHTAEHVRRAGEDLARGRTVLEAGRRLTAADLGVLASVGVAGVGVYRRPRVAFFSTGDELASVEQKLAPGQIYDSNRYTLYAMLREQGVELHDLGVIRDTPEAVADAFERAGQYDAIITSGGVSVGAADHVVDVLERVGDVGFWSVAIKPGRPVAFGRVGRALFFGLPGNPVSVMVGFSQLVRPALVRLAGGTPAAPVRFECRTTRAIRKKPGRREYQRGRL